MDLVFTFRDAHLGAGQRRAADRRQRRRRSRPIRRVRAVYLGESIDELSARARGSRAGYGEAIVISDIIASPGEGRSLAVLGRNGVGKTTLLNTIIGVTRQHGGTIRSPASDITRLPRRSSARSRASAGCRRSATSSGR